MTKDTRKIKSSFHSPKDGHEQSGELWSEKGCEHRPESRYGVKLRCSLWYFCQENILGITAKANGCDSTKGPQWKQKASLESYGQAELK